MGFIFSNSILNSEINYLQIDHLGKKSQEPKPL